MNKDFLNDCVHYGASVGYVLIWVFGIAFFVAILGAMAGQSSIATGPAVIGVLLFWILLISATVGSLIAAIKRYLGR